MKRRKEGQDANKEARKKVGELKKEKIRHNVKVKMRIMEPEKPNCNIIIRENRKMRGK